MRPAPCTVHLQRAGGGAPDPLQSARDPPRPRRAAAHRVVDRPRDPAARRREPRRRCRGRSAPVGHDERGDGRARPTTRRPRRRARRQPTPTPTPTPTPDPDAEFTIVAAGDVLPHLPVLADARVAGGGYDFGPLLAPMNPWVQGADLALCHLEVPDRARRASRPAATRCSAPRREIAAVLQGAGLGRLLDRVEPLGRPRLRGRDRDARRASTPSASATSGTARSARRAVAAAAVPARARGPDDHRRAHRRDVRHQRHAGRRRQAVVGRTSSTSPRWSAQATAARAAGADLVIASVHCCVEYQTEPTARAGGDRPAARRLGRDRPRHRAPRARAAAGGAPDRRAARRGHVGRVRARQLPVEPGRRVLLDGHRLGPAADRPRVERPGAFPARGHARPDRRA